MTYQYIYADVASVVNFTFPAGQTNSPLIIVSPNASGDQTGTKALRALMLPTTFPTTTLTILVSVDPFGDPLYNLWTMDGQNAGVVTIPTQSGTPICLSFPPHWTDSQRSFLFQSSVPMPDDMQCKCVLQPIYKGGV